MVTHSRFSAQNNLLKIFNNETISLYQTSKPLAFLELYKPFAIFQLIISFVKFNLIQTAEFD